MMMCNDCFFKNDCPHQDIFIKLIIEEYDNASGNPLEEACKRFQERHKDNKPNNGLKLKKKYICFDEK